MYIIKECDIKQQCETMAYGCKVTNNNSKMGPLVGSYSNAYALSCPPDVKCKDKCYIQNMKPSVKKSYMTNFERVLAGQYTEIESDVNDYIEKHGYPYFRWFVGGDLYSMDMLKVIIRVAEAHPEVSFLMFTKWYSIMEAYEGDVPKNLHVLLSIWKDYKPSEALSKKYGKAYFDDGTPECGLPEHRYVCPGKCPECGYMCFKAGKHFNVVFEEH